MQKVQNIYAPIRATITPNGGPLDPGESVTIDTNVPALVLYTLDGSAPRFGAFGTLRAEAPVEIPLRTQSRVRFKAIDSRFGKERNATKTQEATFTIPRKNPAEEFRDGKHFYRFLVKSIIDEHFYLTEGKWLLPLSSKPYTYLFVNREPYPVLLRVLHNGVDVFTSFPTVALDGLREVMIRPIAGDNTIEVQTLQQGEVDGGGEEGEPGLYDIGLYDIDTYE